MNSTRTEPATRPANPCFSSGPTAKRPGWTPAVLADACLGRSHRSAPGKAKLAAVIDRSRAILGIPDDYRLGIVPASDTGAVEMALWSLLGPRGVDVLAWESFGKGWVTDVVKQLKLPDTRVIEADYGAIPDLTQVAPDRDVVFTWNGTTSGVRVPDGDWLAGRDALAICDATSAAFAMPLPWDRLDVVTWSWQKVMGGEAQHGMIALSPRAVARLESHTPAWPMPKLFRLTKAGDLVEGVYRGETINTPSMLAVEDHLDALAWAADLGGLPALIARTDANAKVIDDWVDATPWIENLAADPAIRSTTSVCLRLTDSAEAPVAKAMTQLLAEAGVAYDIGAYRDAPAGLRIWAGATVETADLAALMPWLDWAYATARQS